MSIEIKSKAGHIDKDNETKFEMPMQTGMKTQVHTTTKEIEKGRRYKMAHQD